MENGGNYSLYHPSSSSYATPYGSLPRYGSPYPYSTTYDYDKYPELWPLGLHQIIMKQSPFSPFAADDGQRKPWILKNQEDALYFMMEMPGVKVEDAKVFLDGNTLVVKGVRNLDPKFVADRETHPKTKTYTTGIKLMPLSIYKLSQLKAEMKHGVLKVTVPKYKDEERPDLLHIQIN